ETIDYMYGSDPKVIKDYAEFVNVPEPLARKVRDDFFPKSLIWPNDIKGLDSLMEEAVTLKFIPAPLSKQQQTELIQLQEVGSPGSLDRGRLGADQTAGCARREHCIFLPSPHRSRRNNPVHNRRRKAQHWRRSEKLRRRKRGIKGQPRTPARQGEDHEL